jgi:hypothetical protein
MNRTWLLACVALTLPSNSALAQTFTPTAKDVAQYAKAASPSRGYGGTYDPIPSCRRPR